MLIDLTCTKEFLRVVFVIIKFPVEIDPIWGMAWFTKIQPAFTGQNANAKQVQTDIQFYACNRIIHHQIINKWQKICH